MAQIWYYADANGQQVGPVSADEIRAAVRRGAANAATLAWREGLANWTSLAQLAGELQLELGQPTLPPADGMPPPAGAANPYSAPSAMGELRVSSGAAGDIVYAGFWKRFAARVIDHFIVYVPTSILAVFIAGGAAVFTASTTEPNPVAATSMIALMYLLPIAANFLYFSIMHSSSLQASVGKLALGIKVTDSQGRRLDYGQSAIRWFASLLSYMVLCIGFIIAGFTDQKRALHDMLASTLVVDKWAYTSTPERQQRGTSGCLIAFLVVFLLGIFVIIPILAAISISQYQDYVIRSQVSEGSALADGVKTAVGEYWSNNEKPPTSNAEAGLASAASIQGMYVSSVDIGVQPGRIDVSYGAPKANTSLQDKHLYFEANEGNGELHWSCHSEDLKQKWCPSSCNCSG